MKQKKLDEDTDNLDVYKFGTCSVCNEKSLLKNDVCKNPNCRKVDKDNFTNFFHRMVDTHNYNDTK